MAPTRRTDQNATQQGGVKEKNPGIGVKRQRPDPRSPPRTEIRAEDDEQPASTSDRRPASNHGSRRTTAEITNGVQRRPQQGRQAVPAPNRHAQTQKYDSQRQRKPRRERQNRMHETSKRGLTERQRTLLTNARDTIREMPESYNQLTYGIGSIDGRRPGSVAGHVVAANPELRKSLAETLAGKNLTDQAGREYAGAAIHGIAAAALGTPDYPVLFQSQWPRAWLGTKTRVGAGWQYQNGSFVPTPTEAVKVLDRILNGRIEGALSQ